MKDQPKITFREMQGREEVNFTITVKNRLVRFTLSKDQAMHMAKTIMQRYRDAEKAPVENDPGIGA